MTYNEWRDELKSNLLCVSEPERRRVLDYYAEAYADRRDAGFSEREIIQDFGAPYDASQSILAENSYGYYEEEPQKSFAERDRREERRRLKEERENLREERREEKSRRVNQNYSCPPPPPENYYRQPAYTPPPQPQAKTRGDYTWVFVLLCIIFAIPIFIVVLGMVAVTIAFCVAPIAVLISGVVCLGSGVGMLFIEPMTGAVGIGGGLIIFGLSLILMPLFFKLVKWMWKLFTMFFAWLSRMFSGKEKVK